MVRRPLFIWVALMILLIVLACSNNNELIQSYLDKAEKLKKVGGYTILKIKEKQFLFIRNSKESIKVFSPECTHKKCIVTFNPESGHIECPCHESRFDMEGKVLDGPAPKPLRKYTGTLSEDKTRIIFSID